MINNYFIRNVNGEEVLYLNFDFSYEFSSFDFMAKREKIQEVVRNFIRDNKISFKGMTVLLVSGGVLFGSILLNTPNFTGSPVNSIKPIESSVTNDDFVTTNASVTLSNGDSVVINDVKDEKEVKNEKVEQFKNENVQVKENVVSKEEKVQNKEVSTSKVEEKKQVNEVSTPKVEEKSEVKEVATKEVVDNNIYVNVRRGGSVVKIELE